MKNLKKNLPDIIGWSGSVSVLSAYILLISKIEIDPIALDLLNIYGSGAVGYICYLKKAWQPLFLNVSWFIAGGVSMVIKIIS
jgi:hypothetical protein